MEQDKKESLAYELVCDLKKTNKRLNITWLIAWLITFLSFLGLLAYTIWLLNDISYVEETETYTQEVTDFETVNGNVTNKGNTYGEDKTNSQEN